MVKVVAASVSSAAGWTILMGEGKGMEPAKHHEMRTKTNETNKKSSSNDGVWHRQ